MNNSRGFAPLVIVAIVAIVLVLGGAGYVYVRQWATVVPEVSPTVVATSTDTGTIPNSVPVSQSAPTPSATFDQATLNPRSQPFSISGTVTNMSAGNPTVFIGRQPLPPSITNKDVSGSVELGLLRSLPWSTKLTGTANASTSNFSSDIEFDGSGSYPAGAYNVGMYDLISSSKSAQDTVPYIVWKLVATSTLNIATNTPLIYHRDPPGAMAIYVNIEKEFALDIPDAWLVKPIDSDYYIASPTGDVYGTPQFRFAINSVEEDGYSPNHPLQKAKDMPSLVALYSGLGMSVRQITTSNGDKGIEFDNPYQKQLNIVILRSNKTFVHFYCDKEDENTQQTGMPALCEKASLSFKEAYKVFSGA